ncbi:MAG: tetratricopeptide repeat protein [Anaerolineales bacterium]
MNAADQMEQGKQAYRQGDYLQAAQAFEQAAQGFAREGKMLESAEARNNQSVALLMSGDAQAALRAVEGTPEIFAQHQDLEREGMAWGNQGAALEALGRLDEAIQAYRIAAERFEAIQNADLRVEMEKAIAAIRLKQGRFMDAGLEMLSTLNRPNPTWWQRLLRWLLRVR